MTEPKSDTLDVPGAVLHYDIRSNDASTEPPLLLIGSPMGAQGFVTLAGHFPDRTVVTYDPRGAERSTRTDGATETTPDEHADDLHRLITTLDAGAVDLFATSGGAVNALALVTVHPQQVHTLVAHEPPAAAMLPDRDAIVSTAEAIRETYYREGVGPAMARFIGLVSEQGPLPADYASRPGPDAATFGLPTVDDGARDDPLVGQNIVTCLAYEHDLDALRAASTHVVIAVGAMSSDAIPGRAAVALAERLETTPVTFPGGHDGFLGGEYGGFGEPEAFATTLRETLAERAG
jgi:pimeloyl-ACP methyl ester carboxylesterase